MKTPTPPSPRPRLPPRRAVALQGFSDFERAALASFFRLAAARTPSYTQVDEADRADFLIADGDDPQALAAVRAGGREAETVFVGRQAPHDAMAWLPRPIDPVQILRELDALAAPPRAAGGHPAPAVPPAIVVMPEPGPESAPVPLPKVGGRGREVLVVDDSAIARRFMQQRLEQLGYRVQLARSGEEALEAVEAMPFSIVFLDVALGGPGRLDGFQVCQRLRQRPLSLDDTEPAIVIVTGSKDAADRVRGSLAGCDAYLTKPLGAGPLMHVLRQVDPGFDHTGETMLG